jgi:hypothetical protein
MTYADFETSILNYFTGQAPTVMREIKGYVKRKVPEDRLADLWEWLIETQNPGRKIGVSDMVNGCNVCTIKLIGRGSTPEEVFPVMSREEIAENFRNINAQLAELAKTKRCGTVLAE